MWGTSSSDDKITGDLGNVIEATQIGGRRWNRLVAGNLSPGKPADLPFELPTRYELIVNLKSAKAIGLKLPDAFVLLADEVLE
jgi:ABC-type uncharacterized transport system substrate-binding protein